MDTLERLKPHCIRFALNFVQQPSEDSEIGAAHTTIAIQNWLEVYTDICEMMVIDEASGPDKHGTQSETMDLEVE